VLGQAWASSPAEPNEPSEGKSTMYPEKVNKSDLEVRKIVRNSHFEKKISLNPNCFSHLKGNKLVINIEDISFV